LLSQMIGFKAPTRSDDASNITTFDDSSVNISTFAPTIAVADTLSDTATAISIVSLKAGSLQGLAEILVHMRSLTEEAVSASAEGEIDTYNRLVAELEHQEAEISKFVGKNLASPESFTTTLVESEGNFEKRFFQVLDMSEIDGFELLASIEVDMASVLTHAHPASGCPICESLGGVTDADSLSSMSGTGAHQLNISDQTSFATGNISDDTTASRTAAGTSSITATASTTGYIDPLIKGPVWDFSAGENLSYSFYDGTVGYVDYTAAGQADFPGAAAAFNTAQQNEMRSVYDTWSAYAPFDFEEITEAAAGEVVGDLRVAYMTNPALKAPGVAAFAYYPSASPIGGDTWYILNGVQNTGGSAALANNLTFAETTYGRMTALHEIGHSIGLSHPFDGGSSTGQTLTVNGYTDDMRTTVMSYTNSVDNFAYFESGGSLSSGSIYSNTPMIYDIAAIEYLYGAITDTNAGDTTFALTNRLEIQTLVDSGGEDTIDLSNMVYRSIVDLTPGSLSSIGYATESEQEAYWLGQGYSTANSYISSANLFTGQDNLGIAFSATIENVIGSDGDDQITGNDANNIIKGGLGDDVISGGSGLDYAVFSGNIDDYSISGTSTLTITDRDSSDGNDGIDTVSGVEYLEFRDITYEISSGAMVSTRPGGALAGNSSVSDFANPIPWTVGNEDDTSPPHKISGLRIHTKESAAAALGTIDIAFEIVQDQITALGLAENLLLAKLDQNYESSIAMKASLGRILDADIAAEIATLSKAQIIQSAGLQVLKLANGFQDFVTQILSPRN